MRLYMIAVVMVCLMVLPADVRAEARFFEDLGDVPVAPALIELTDRALVFDKPEGRIAQVVALCPPGTAFAGIEAFYKESLPQLGWRPGAAGSYAREGETLTISPLREAGRELVVFRLEPR